jgi:hypothetical protein
VKGSGFEFIHGVYSFGNLKSAYNTYFSLCVNTEQLLDLAASRLMFVHHIVKFRALPTAATFCCDVSNVIFAFWTVALCFSLVVTLFWS